MKFIKGHATYFGVLLFMVLLPLVSFAQNPIVLPPPGEIIIPSPCDPGKICNPLKASGVNDVPSFIKMVLSGVLRIGIPLIALAIIYCGFLFVFARGKPEAIQKARDALLYTLIGAAILLGSWALAQLINETVRGLS